MGGGWVGGGPFEGLLLGWDGDEDGVFVLNFFLSLVNHHHHHI